MTAEVSLRNQRKPALTERRYRRAKEHFMFGQKNKSTWRSTATADVFKYHFGVQPHGNAPEGSDPQDEFRGKNILIERHTISGTAQHFKKNEDEVRKSLARSRGKLCSRSEANAPDRIWMIKLLLGGMV